MAAGVSLAPSSALRAVRLPRESEGVRAVLQWLDEEPHRRRTHRIRFVLAAALAGGIPRAEIWAAFEGAAPRAVLVNHSHFFPHVPFAAAFATRPEAFACILRTPGCLDVLQETWFGGLSDELLPTLKAFATERNLCVEVHPCSMFLLDSPEKLRPPAPGPEASAAAVGPLREADAPVVLDTWLYKDELPNMIELVRHLVRHLPTRGLFAQGEPTAVAWALQQFSGEIGMVHTLPKYRRKGFAAVAVTALARVLLGTGAAPFCYIVDSNEASKALFTQLGFERVEGVSWTQLSPPATHEAGAHAQH
jgi:GNAT superfamily N-acetyltransferase